MARGARAKAPMRAKLLRAELVRLVRDPLLIALALLMTLSLLDAHIWLGALVDELGFVFALLALLGCLVCALKRQYARALALAACALFFAQEELPQLRATRPTPEHGPTLRIVQAHAAGVPLSAARLARLLAETDADVASLTGLTKRDQEVLSSRHANYEPVPPETGTQILLIKRDLRAAPRASSVRLGRCQVALVQVDLPSLFAATSLSERRRQIARLAHRPREARRIWLGHFGSRSDASDLTPLRAGEELRDVRLGHGRLATVPAALGALGLPVDQILLHGWILARSADILPPLADGMHRTLSATLELTEPRCTKREPARR